MSGQAVHSRPWKPGEPVHVAGFGVLLRSLRAEDIDEEFMNRFRDPRVTQHLALVRDPARAGRDVFLKELASYDNRRRFFLLVTSADGRDHLGFCLARAEGVDVYSLTIAITDPALWRRNAALAAGYTLRCFLFDVVKAHKLMARVYEENTAAIRGLEKYGIWVPEGVLREHEPDGKGGRRNVLLFGMLREDHLAGPVVPAYEVAKK